MVPKITCVTKCRIMLYIVYHIFKDLFISILYVMFSYLYICVPCVSLLLPMDATRGSQSPLEL